MLKLNQKNKFNLTLMLFIIAFFPMIKVDAATNYFINSKASTYKSCSIRTAPNEGGDWLIPGSVQWLDPGDMVTTVDGVAAVTSTTAACQSSYHYVSYNGVPGYVCGDYIEFNPVHTYDQYFTDLGFPSIYLPYLNTLKTLHPTWNFNAIKTNLDWNTVLDNESQLGVSLVNTTNPGWISTADGSYNYYTDTFSDNFDGAGWFAANREIVGYYMDPRNFMNDTDVFMFQNLKYDATQTEEVVKSILSNTFMANPFTDTDGVARTYSSIFMDVGSQTGVSPYLLASRVKQEVCIGTTGYSGSVSGTVPGYVGYFNFFNINAYATGGVDAITNGLSWAKSHNWNTRYKSILGGSQVLGSGYITLGQDTLYLQKWDLIGDLYSHQYMSNIMAPKSEARSIYNAYDTIGVLNSNLIFNIPIYENMPTFSAPLPSVANPNNYLKTLTINGKSIFGFDGGITDYTYNTSGLTLTAEIGATTINSNAKVSGLGVSTLSSKEQTLIVRVTAENGAVRDYSIKVVKADTVPISVTEIANGITSIGIKNNGTYMTGINIGTNVNIITDKVSQITDAASVTIKNDNGESISNVAFATGDKVVITSSSESKEYTVIIYGDANGDGTIGIADLLRVQKKILNQINLSDPYLKATDVNHDNKTDILDLLRVQKSILGLSKIEQIGGVV